MVAIILDNRAEFMIAWLAVVALRATLVSVNPDVKEHDARHVLRDSAAVLVIISPKHQALIDAVRGDCPALRDVIVIGDNEPDGLPGRAGTTFSLGRRRRASATTSRTCTTRRAPRARPRAAWSATSGGCARSTWTCGCTPRGRTTGCCAACSSTTPTRAGRCSPRCAAAARSWSCAGSACPGSGTWSGPPGSPRSSASRRSPPCCSRPSRPRPTATTRSSGRCRSRWPRTCTGR